jgi:hypothetical protein
VAELKARVKNGRGQRAWAYQDWMQPYLPWGIRVRLWKFAFPTSIVSVHLYPFWTFYRKERARNTREGA